MLALDRGGHAPIAIDLSKHQEEERANEIEKTKETGPVWEMGIPVGEKLIEEIVEEKCGYQPADPASAKCPLGKSENTTKSAKLKRKPSRLAGNLHPAWLTVKPL